MRMAENNIEWGRGGEFNIKSNLNKKLLFRQAVLYTFGQDCRTLPQFLSHTKRHELSFLPRTNSLLKSKDSTS